MFDGPDLSTIMMTNNQTSLMRSHGLFTLASPCLHLGVPSTV